jgi:hypothetical protein
MNTYFVGDLRAVFAAHHDTPIPKNRFSSHLPLSADLPLRSLASIFFHYNYIIKIITLLSPCFVRADQGSPHGLSH